MHLDSLLKEMDLEFFGTGQHGVGPEGAVKLIGKDNVFFLDVRTKEEYELLRFPFAHHIPTNEVPDRLNEIPKDKLIIVFCSSVVRASIIYAYLLEKGYDEVKVLLGSAEQLVILLKPKPIYSRKMG
jgi:rhodanese-related sulfurtransferase